MTDHKTVGLQYAVTSLFFLLVGFLLMLLMRWQLAWPGQPLPAWLTPVLGAANAPGGIMLPEFYNQLVAMHGTVMIFLAVVPLAAGAFGNLAGAATDWRRRHGAAAHQRARLLALRARRRGDDRQLLRRGRRRELRMDVVSASVHHGHVRPDLVADRHGVRQRLGHLVVRLDDHHHRARAGAGVTLARMPFFVWSQLVTALLLLLAFPALQAAAVFQLMDRVAGTSFFLPSGLVLGGIPLQHYAGGGSPLLWQHLFWFLAHPEVYVLILPAMGIVSEVIVSNTRRPLWGYGLMVSAVLFLGFMSMLVWAHHMFLTGMGTTLSSFFQVTTMIVSIPSVVLVTALVMSLWGGSIRFPTAMLFALAFLPMFGIGGLTGLPLGLAASDITLHDTYYVVAHFHYLVAPGTVFALFAGIYHWYPSVTGRVLSERLGKWHFWLSFFLMNNIFLPMFFVGLAGVNRRLYDAGAQFAMAQPYQGLQRHMTVAAIALGLAQIPFLIALATARRASPIEAGQTRIAAVPRAERGHRPLARRRLADDVLRIVALGLRAVAGGQCRLAGARQRLGARARWLGAAGRGGGRGAADTGGASRLGRVGWSTARVAVNAARRRVQGRAAPRFRTSSLRRGSRSRVCCSPSSPSCVARRRGMRFFTQPACPRGRAGSGSSGDRCH